MNFQLLDVIAPPFLERGFWQIVGLIAVSFIVIAAVVVLLVLLLRRRASKKSPPPEERGGGYMLARPSDGANGERSARQGEQKEERAEFSVCGREPDQGGQNADGETQRETVRNTDGDMRQDEGQER